MLACLGVGMQEINAQESAGILSYKNVARIEKASSTLTLLSLIPIVVLHNCNKENLVPIAATAYPLFAAINISANLSLGFGYKKEKKAFIRAISPGLFFVHATVHGKISKSICPVINFAGLFGVIVRECIDLYAMFTAEKLAKESILE